MPKLYLIEIPHQTTTRSFVRRFTRCCILSKFHIKPQPVPLFDDSLVVVSYRNSTSNHNGSNETNMGESVVSYRNSTSNHNSFSDVVESITVVSYRNSTSNHNLVPLVVYYRVVVSYRNSTSNHNVWLAKGTHQRLYLIEILHQTTTPCRGSRRRRSCILSKFYIKPQQ